MKTKALKKKKTEKQILLFDIGDVLLRIDWKKAQKMLQLTDAQVVEIRSGTLHDAYERGTISGDDFFHGIRNEFKLDAPLEKMQQAWNAVIAGEIAGMHDLINDYRGQFDIFGLSNTNESHWNFEIKKYRMFTRFEEVYKSYELGLRKPELEIYQAALRRMGVTAENVFFVDDKKENVAGARKGGMHAVVFPGSAAKLRPQIEKFKNS